MARHNHRRSTRAVAHEVCFTLGIRCKKLCFLGFVHYHACLLHISPFICMIPSQHVQSLLELTVSVYTWCEFEWLLLCGDGVIDQENFDALFMASAS